MIRRGLLALGVALLMLWPATALAQGDAGVAATDQVVLSGDVSVPRGSVVDEVVVFSGSATIGGVAQGDVVVVDGPITIGGQVGGDVVALHGPVRLLASAQVTGDVLAGGNVVIAEGAQVLGEVRRDVGFTLSGPVAVLGALLASIAMAASILLVGLLILLLAPRGAERTAEAAQSRPIASAAWGLLLTLAVPILSVVAAVTIIGLPLGLAVLLGLGLLWLIGQALVTFVIGRLFVPAPRSRVGALLAGWGIAAAVGLVPFLNVAWWTLGSVFGLGAMLVAAWRVRSGVSEPTLTDRRGGRHKASRSPRPPDMPLAED